MKFKYLPIFLCVFSLWKVVTSLPTNKELILEENLNVTSPSTMGVTTKLSRKACAEKYQEDFGDYGLYLMCYPTATILGERNDWHEKFKTGPPPKLRLP